MARPGGVHRVVAGHHRVTVGHGGGGGRGVPDVVPRQPVVQRRYVVVQGLVAGPVAHVWRTSMGTSGVNPQPRQIFLQ